MAAQDGVFDILKVEDVYYVEDVCLQPDVAIQEMRTFAKAGERWRVHRVPSGTKALRHAPPAPASVPRPMDQHECACASSEWLGIGLTRECGAHNAGTGRF